MSDQQLPTDINEIDWRAKTFDDLIEHWDLIEIKNKGYEKILDIMSDPKGLFYMPADKLERYRSKWQEEISRDATALIIRSCDYFQIESNADTHKVLSLRLFAELNKRVKKRPQGREPKWGFFEKYALVIDVENLIEDGLTVEQACKQLVKDKPSLISSTEDGMQEPHQTLARFYRRFSKELVQSLQDFLSKDHEQPKSNTD